MSRPAATIEIKLLMPRHATALAPSHPSFAAAGQDAIPKSMRGPIRFLQTPPDPVMEGQIGQATDRSAAPASERHHRAPSFAPPPSHRREGVAEAWPRRHHPRLLLGPPGGALRRRRGGEEEVEGGGGG